MKTLTKAKLVRFVKTRNKSGFSSNLQFQIDCNAAGFEVGDLGDPEKFTLDGFTGYLWKPIIQVPSRNKPSISRPEVIRLVEFGRGLHLEGHGDSAQMLDLMRRKAEFEKKAA